MPINSSYLCYISKTVMRNPVALFEDNSKFYEKEVIEIHFKLNGQRSPASNQEVPATLMSLGTLKDDINLTLINNPSLFETAEEIDECCGVYIPWAWWHDLHGAIFADDLNKFKKCIENDPRLLTLTPAEAWIRQITYQHPDKEKISEQNLTAEALAEAHSAYTILGYIKQICQMREFEAKHKHQKELVEQDKNKRKRVRRKQKVAQAAVMNNIVPPIADQLPGQHIAPPGGLIADDIQVGEYIEEKKEEAANSSKHVKANKINILPYQANNGQNKPNILHAHQPLSNSGKLLAIAAKSWRLLRQRPWHILTISVAFLSIPLFIRWSNKSIPINDKLKLSSSDANISSYNSINQQMPVPLISPNTSYDNKGTKVSTINYQPEPPLRSQTKLPTSNELHKAIVAEMGNDAAILHLEKKIFSYNNVITSSGPLNQTNIIIIPYLNALATANADFAYTLLGTTPVTYSQISSAKKHFKEAVKYFSQSLQLVKRSSHIETYKYYIAHEEATTHLKLGASYRGISDITYNELSQRLNNLSTDKTKEIKLAFTECKNPLLKAIKHLENYLQVASSSSTELDAVYNYLATCYFMLTDLARMEQKYMSKNSIEFTEQAFKHLVKSYSYWLKYKKISNEQILLASQDDLEMRIVKLIGEIGKGNQLTILNKLLKDSKFHSLKNEIRALLNKVSPAITQGLPKQADVAPQTAKSASINSSIKNINQSKPEPTQTSINVPKLIPGNLEDALKAYGTIHYKLGKKHNSTIAYLESKIINDTHSLPCYGTPYHPMTFWGILGYAYLEAAKYPLDLKYLKPAIEVFEKALSFYPNQQPKNENTVSLPNGLSEFILKQKMSYLLNIAVARKQIADIDLNTLLDKVEVLPTNKQKIQVINEYRDHNLAAIRYLKQYIEMNAKPLKDLGDIYVTIAESYFRLNDITHAKNYILPPTRTLHEESIVYLLEAFAYIRKYEKLYLKEDSHQPPKPTEQTRNVLIERIKIIEKEHANGLLKEIYDSKRHLQLASEMEEILSIIYNNKMNHAASTDRPKLK